MHCAGFSSNIKKYLRNIVESIFGHLVLEVVLVGDGVVEVGVLLGHLQDPVPPVVGPLH